jgi:hypothetical protein
MTAVLNTAFRSWAERIFMNRDVCAQYAKGEMKGKDTFPLCGFRSTSDGAQIRVLHVGVDSEGLFLQMKASGYMGPWESERIRDANGPFFNEYSLTYPYQEIASGRVVKSEWRDETVESVLREGTAGKGPFTFV